MRGQATVTAADRLSRPPRSKPVRVWPAAADRQVVHLDDDSLRSPIHQGLRPRVQSLLYRGERSIVVDLGRVSSIDAAGIGELVRAYNLAAASDARLRIANATPWVRQILERVGLFSRLSASQT